MPDVDFTVRSAAVAREFTESHACLPMSASSLPTRSPCTTPPASASSPVPRPTSYLPAQPPMCSACAAARYPMPSAERRPGVPAVGLQAGVRRASPSRGQASPSWPRLVPAPLRHERPKHPARALPRLMPGTGDQPAVAETAASDKGSTQAPLGRAVRGLRPTPAGVIVGDRHTRAGPSAPSTERGARGSSRVSGSLVAAKVGTRRFRKRDGVDARRRKPLRRDERRAEVRPACAGYCSASRRVIHHARRIVLRLPAGLPSAPAFQAAYTAARGLAPPPALA